MRTLNSDGTMIKILLIAMLLFAFGACNGQIMLEKTFEEGEVIVGSNAYYNVEANSEYFITFDSKKQVLNFYNEDFSLYKSLTNIFGGDDVSCMPSYVTRHLFNSDNKLEFLAYITTKEGLVTVKIVNEDGKVLEDFGSASSAYCIKVKGEIKLLVNS